MAESISAKNSESFTGRVNVSRILARPTRAIGIENICIGWLAESNKDESQELTDSVLQLCQVAGSVQTFSDPNEFVDYTTKLKDEKLFAIISASCAKYIVPFVNDLPQIDSIYILSRETPEHKEWTTQHQKIKGVFTNITSLYEYLKRHASQTEHSLTSISIFSSDILGASDKVELNRIDSSFMYSQLIKEMILEIPYEQNETDLRDEFTEFCRSRYADNPVTLKVIEEFNREYYLRTPVWWYTRDTFVYRMLNHALRFSEAEVLIRMAFFIKDLHQQLEQLHSTVHTHPSVVYRGQKYLFILTQKA